MIKGREKLLFSFLTKFIILSFCVFSCKSAKENNPNDIKAPPPRADLSDDVLGDTPASSEDKQRAFFLKSNPELFPKSGEAFVVSFFIEQTAEATFDKRMRLITNYDSERAPSSGWAIAIKRLKTSTRFDVYLKDKNGLGGWYSLSPVPELNENIKLAVTFIIEPSTFISGFISKVDNKYEPTSKSSKQIGGILVDPLDEIISKGDFHVTSGIVSSNTFKGSIKDVSIFRLNEVPPIEEFKKISNGGPRSLLKVFSDFCIMSQVEGSTCEIKH